MNGAFDCGLWQRKRKKRFLTLLSTVLDGKSFYAKLLILQGSLVSYIKQAPLQSLLDCYKTIHGLSAGLICKDYFEFDSYGKTRSNHSFK